MTNRICSIEGCDKPSKSRSWCWTHYKRWQTTGSTERKPKEARFWSHVDQSDGCWIWRSYVTKTGYGRFFDSNKAVAAHRFVYELLVGPIPDTYEIDHICHNRRCVNPEHLRLATRKQNQEHRVKANSNSRTGIRGVHWHKASQRWIATVGHQQRRLCVGYFDTIEEAEAAVIARRNELFAYNDQDRQ